jgi:hypothetical protein
MGLVVFAAMGLYLVIAIFVFFRVGIIAEKHVQNPDRWAWGSALVMFLIPYWDLLPTIIADQYNCSSNAGFFVYKTVDQWKQQNPGVMETLSMAHLPEQHRIENDKVFKDDRRYLLPDGTLLTARIDVRGELGYIEYKRRDGESGYQLNERFRYTRKTEGPDLIKLSREEITVVDIQNNEVMARQVDFQQSPGEAAWKFWFHSYDGCFKDYPEKFPNGGIHKFIDSLRTDCRQERDIVVVPIEMIANPSIHRSCAKSRAAR